MLFSNKDDKLKKATAHVISKEDIRKKEEIKEETKKQELIKMSIQLLTKKFGVLPKEIKDKIEKSDYSDLEVIMGEIFEFKDLDDVRKYLQ